MCKGHMYFLQSSLRGFPTWSHHGGNTQYVLAVSSLPRRWAGEAGSPETLQQRELEVPGAQGALSRGWWQGAVSLSSLPFVIIKGH